MTLPPRVNTVFFGHDDRLRPIWRVLIFYAAGIFVVSPTVSWPIVLIVRALHLPGGLTAGNIALGEISNFLIAFICTGAFALYEHRRVDTYGLQLNRALKLPMWEGAAAGVIMAAAVGAGMFFLGAMQISGLAIHGTALALSALAWLAANICIGIAEELWFRSYVQVTLWKSIGFWPASIAIALVFAAAHYFFKPGENVWDVITLVSLSLLLSYSFLRTGTLWFAVGFHMAFDYMQLFIIGTPNGGRIPAGRLLNATFNGPAWLTGGTLGTEASFLMYPAIVLLWIYVWWRYRTNPPLHPEHPTSL